VFVFSVSDKGGTGRSVTSSNIVYRRALQGSDVCYLDFDFGSPTAGTMFQVASAARGTTKSGLHSYLHGDTATPHSLEVWDESEADSLRGQPSGAGRLVLYPGDKGGGEFSRTDEMVGRCVDLFLRLEEEYDLCLVDLSAGRSYAVDLVLAATAGPKMAAVQCRWLVFHRWTRQHIISAADLVFGEQGMTRFGKLFGHDEQALDNAIRFVRTVVVDPNSESLAGLRPAQIAWLRNCNTDLHRLAKDHGIGRTRVLGSVPLDPVLQWREQLISDDDVALTRVANQATVDAFTELAARLTDDKAWEGL
jgi:hypothetical protein